MDIKKQSRHFISLLQNIFVLVQISLVFVSFASFAARLLVFV